MTYLDGGPWTSDDHARHPSFDAGLMAAIEALRPTWAGARVFDVGGGPGRYVESLDRFGAYCNVVEPEPMRLPGAVRQWLSSLTDAAWFVNPRPADVVLCLEVMEHVPREHHDLAFDNLCALVAEGGILVWSAATPGQGGQGHVAERSQMEWADELGERGLMLDLEESARLRLAATLPWFRSNVMVWRRP